MNNTDIEIKLWESIAFSDQDFSDIQVYALANYLFREIIEDIHSEYNIPDSKIKELNIKAVNRAKLFLEKIVYDSEMLDAFLIQAYGTTNWDKPEITSEEKQLLDYLNKIASYIKTL